MSDPHRPLFHLTAPAGWLNDPNGLCLRDGVYHAFYQHNPHACVHGDVRGNTYWGHARSTDLLHWEHLPIALSPDPDAPDVASPDRDGCWSGVLVDDAGTPTLVYSGHRRGRTQLPCLATASDPELLTWVKHPANPVLDAPPEGLGVVEFRDHCVWAEGPGWRQVVSAGVATGGAALLFAAERLDSWRFTGVLAAGPLGPETGERGPGDVWECVDVIPFPGGRHLLVFGLWRDGRTLWTAYAVGTISDNRFRAERSGILDAGLRHFYAPQSFVAADGRRLMFGWAQEGRSDEAAERAGWSGAFSLPREITLVDGDVHQAPAAELVGLRASGTPVDLDVVPDTAADLGHSGTRLDLDLRVRLAPGSEIAVEVRRSPCGEETTRLVLATGDGSTVRFRLDRSRSSLEPGLDTSEHTGTTPERAPAAEAEVEVRVVLDGSVLEVFVAGRALTSRIYPSSPDATGLRVVGVAGSAQVRGTIWSLVP